MFERLRKTQQDGPSSRLVLEMPLNGNLDQVVRLFIKTLGGGLQAIALALSTPHDNSAQVQAEIDKYAAEVKATASALDLATKQSKGEK